MIPLPVQTLTESTWQKSSSFTRNLRFFISFTLCIYYIRNLNKIQIVFIKIFFLNYPLHTREGCGFPGILAEPHYHKEFHQPFSSLWRRDRESNSDQTFAQEGLAIPWDTITPPRHINGDLQLEESTKSPEAHIYLYTAPRRNKYLRRRRAGLMAIRAVYGDGLRCRPPYHPWYHLFSRQGSPPGELTRHKNGASFETPYSLTIQSALWQSHSQSPPHSPSQ